MRKALRWLLSLVVLIGTVSAAGMSTATAARPADATNKTGSADNVDNTDNTDQADNADIKDRLLAIPGMSLIEEKPYTGYRYFVLGYTQPVDHRHPSKGTFQQRITVLHKDVSRPTVMFTSGYNVSTNPSRSEPTRIVDGNQVSVEYRFFTPSRPQPADWSKLDIWQAASDQHRIYQALKPVYGQNWLTTGGSKGGMTATYYERFYPRDMDGVVAYVAPNDVVNDEDSAYDRFLGHVGPEDCRVALQKVQRETLVRRTALEEKYKEYLTAHDYTVNTVGSLDKAYEATVLDLVWGFWQYQPESACADVPDAATVTDQALFDYVDAVGGWSSYADQGLEQYTPYYYQAGTQLGSPDIRQPWLGHLSRYGYQPPRDFVPRTIPMTFQPYAMRDVDTWVRHHATRMLYVYGDNDPWGAERFRLGAGARDSYVLTAPHANHGANVAALEADDKALATSRILAWAGLSGTTAKAPHDAKLDRTENARKFTLRP